MLRTILNSRCASTRWSVPPTHRIAYRRALTNVEVTEELRHTLGLCPGAPSIL